MMSFEYSTSPPAGAAEIFHQTFDWQESVLDKDLTAPPGGESAGDRYIVGAGATGAWSGQDDAIAEWDGLAWLFLTPDAGFRTYVEDETKDYRFDGSWALADPIGNQTITREAGGAGDVVAGSALWETADVLTADNTAASRTFTVPTAKVAALVVESENTYHQFSFKDEIGLAATNPLVIATEGAETIDGAASVSIAVDYGGLTIYSNGTNWFIRR